MDLIGAAAFTDNAGERVNVQTAMAQAQEANLTHGTSDICWILFVCTWWPQTCRMHRWQSSRYTGPAHGPHQIWQSERPWRVMEATKALGRRKVSLDIPVMRIEEWIVEVGRLVRLSIKISPPAILGCIRIADASASTVDKRDNGTFCFDWTTNSGSTWSFILTLARASLIICRNDQQTIDTILVVNTLLYCARV